MTREIKFRAWDKIDNTMAIVEEWHKTWIAIGVNDEDSGHLEQRKIEDVELMQFTGLLDKNGKEIYEGCIVNVMNEFPDGYKMEGVTTVEKRGLSWEFMNGERFIYIGKLNGEPDSLHTTTQLEVIGNKYENPELIK